MMACWAVLSGIVPLLEASVTAGFPSASATGTFCLPGPPTVCKIMAF